MAAINFLTGFNIANVELVHILTDETTPASYWFKTASRADCALAVDAGQEVVQRIKNSIMGMIKTDDIVKGYDITLEDQRLIAEVYALVDGGTVSESQGAFSGYAGPVAGSNVTRKKFTLTLYTSDRDAGGNANKYYSWAFTGCTGKPVPLGAEDNAFHTMQYTIESRPASGSAVVTVTPVDALPTTEGT